MWCSNLQMITQAMPFLNDRTDEDGPVLVDWLPWNHTFGGNQNVGICLYNGGTLYIDEGKPTAKGMAQTLANLREIAPTIYFNCPGFANVAWMEADTVLRENLVQPRPASFLPAPASMRVGRWTGSPNNVASAPGITGLGMTETAPACTFALRPGAVRSGHIGLPNPGVELKLVPNAEGSGKTEIRFRGPNVTPGYWRAPEQTADAFDDEGFYRTGDAVRYVTRPIRSGTVVRRRIAEDFSCPAQLRHLARARQVIARATRLCRTL